MGARIYKENQKGEKFYRLDFIELEGGSEYFKDYAISALFEENGASATKVKELTKGSEVSFDGAVGEYDTFKKNLSITNCKLK